MPPIPLPLKGACRCGRVEIEVTKAPICTAACHCRGCQKMSSSAYSLTAMVPADGFAVTKGETVIGGLHGADLQHNSCDHCKTWLFTRIAGVDWFVNVRPTMLEETAWFHPFMETYTRTRLAFAATGAIRSFAEFPEMEELEPLVQEYQVWATGAALD